MFMARLVGVVEQFRKVGDRFGVEVGQSGVEQMDVQEGDNRVLRLLALRRAVPLAL